MKILNTLITATLIFLIWACSSSSTQQQEMKSTVETQAPKITQKPFGKLPTGEEVLLFTLKNSQGISMSVTNYGGIITSLFVPDKAGTFEDIVLGYNNLDNYLNENPYFGAIIGRYGNRIAKGQFNIDGKQYQLATNNNENHLHGGPKGFDKVLWQASTFEQDSAVGIVFTRTSPHLEENYPGNLVSKIIYTLNNKNQLKFEYEATTDQATIVNLTNHSYFNLSGKEGTSILEHELMLKANHFLPVDKGLIPTGELRNVEGTPFDFKNPTAIGAKINMDNQQLKFGLGYDHCWVFNDSINSIKFVGNLYEPTSGRLMNIYTTEPAVQFYSGNFLDGTLTGKSGTKYNQRTGLCLETQHYPDSPNQPEFPSTLLRPKQVYQSATIYEFTIK